MEIPKELSWKVFGACRYTDPDMMFIEGWKICNKMKRVYCDNCPVKHRCLADALERGEQNGIWGGMTEYERIRLVNIYPGVTNWKLLLGV